MPRPFEIFSNRHTQCCCAVLMLAALFTVPDPVIAAADKMPIRWSPSTESAATLEVHDSSNGMTLVFLGLLLAGAIVARQIVQRRRQGRIKSGPAGSVVMLSRQRIDEELTIRMLQVGPRILIVGSSAQGLTTLSEIADPSEIATILGQDPQTQTTNHSSVPFDGQGEADSTLNSRKVCSSRRTEKSAATSFVG